MMEDLWVLYCGESGPPNFDFLSHPSSCTNHLLIICLDIVLLVMLLFTMFHKSLSSKSAHISARFLGFSRLQIVSAIVNGCLGFVYLSLGTWILVQKLRGSGSALPLDWWLLTLFQGITWLLVSFDFFDVGFVGKLIIISNNCPPLRKSEIEYYACQGLRLLRK